MYWKLNSDYCSGVRQEVGGGGMVWGPLIFIGHLAVPFEFVMSMCWLL